MSHQSILEYINELAKLYFQAKKIEKTQMLDHATQITQLHRKTLIRKLKSSKINILKNNKKRCGAKQKYSKPLLLPHIEYLWKKMERISARRMKASFKDWLPYYDKNNVNNQIKTILQEMSVSTLDRFLKILRNRYRDTKNGISSTPPTTHMKNKVPINTLHSDITRPGYTQADTVAHCGDKLAGQFMNSITITDIFSTWTENRTLLTKKAKEVKHWLNHIQKNLPFKLIAINTDSGSEFLNLPVINQFRENKVIFTRSRPYKKNDNCYVEQKNCTHVREIFHYYRIEHKELQSIMNDIYINYWNPRQNFFSPSFKLKKKIRIGAKVKKTYDEPLTPYERLINSPHVSEEQKKVLIQQRKKLNPFELVEGLEKKLAEFFKLLNLYDKQRKKNESTSFYHKSLPLGNNLL